MSGDERDRPRIEDDDWVCLSFERDEHVLVVTIDNPTSEMNVVDQQLHHELTRVFGALRDERHARCVLLTGRGRAFSAGGDFSWFPTLRGADRLEELRLDARRMIWDLLDVHLPIVCALNGHAAGLGASIALLCDVILMADTASIGDPHVRIGIVAGDGGTVAWPMAVGPARAKEYLLTGDPVPAVEAERIGLVNHVVAAAELDDRARAFAHRLAANAPLAVQYTKQAINAHLKQVLNVSFDRATALELATLATEDHEEALRAIAEHRRPEFKGR